MTTEILFAGFGGQGLLFVGKYFATKGLLEGKQVSWLPSYGPEMRGGTANCNVIISDDPVGSPIVSKPDVLVVMNLPSLDKYESTVKPGGTIIVDSAMIERKVQRDDVRVIYIPATRLAGEIGAQNLANMVIAGVMMKECPEAFPQEGLENALKKVVSARHADLYDLNLKAIMTGLGYVESC
ncbi:MAG: 2-oxoacid:acceptor oxidoreductase family protein [Lachnospiraceae bacterium]|nr:2-oxoacid:acceptor oxidoreductase family protein [Lachnospiraceae bacterium]